MNTIGAQFKWSQLNAHRRLMLALGALLAAGVLIPGFVSMPLRIAIAWDCGVWTFIGLTWLMVAHSPKDKMRATVLANDQGRVGVLLLVLCVIAVSVAAIFGLLQKPKSGDGAAAPQVAIAVLTIVSSWLLMHLMFALHYAHRFYRDDPTTPEQDATEGLAFPGGAAPDYWDFIYFAFVVGMTFQVSDVQVTSRGMRRLVLSHSVAAFAFYTIVLALSINIVAGLI
jgi:uncharacterized membrane protein